jgi:ribosomal protein S18 acetylase RimI-like enzyme
VTEPAVSFRLATRKDIDAVVEVHLAAFPGFFLSMLGPDFLRTMYEAFLLSNGGIFMVGEAGGVIRGFAVGAMKSAGKDRDIARRYAMRFFLSSVPGVLRHPAKVGRRLLVRLTSGGDEYSVPDCAATLRSIGVFPDMRGRQFAGELLREFERRASVLGAKSVALTTDASDNARAIRFYLKNRYEISESFESGEGRAMLLMVKPLSPCNEKPGD